MSNCVSDRCQRLEQSSAITLCSEAPPIVATGVWTSYAQADGAMLQVRDGPSRVVEAFLHGGSEADTFPGPRPSCRDNDEDHSTYLAEDLLPALGGNTGLAAREVGEERQKAGSPSPISFSGFAPLRRFFTEMGSCRVGGSWESRGQDERRNENQTN